jgi:hypothetical protein
MRFFIFAFSLLLALALRPAGPQRKGCGGRRSLVEFPKF